MGLEKISENTALVKVDAADYSEMLFPTVGWRLNEMVNSVVEEEKSDIFISGSNGVGKTEFIKRYAKVYGYKLQEVIPNPENPQLFKSELEGTKSNALGVDTGAKGALSSLDTKKSILLVDEAAFMTETMQKDLFRLIDTRRYTPFGGEEITFEGRIAIVLDRSREKYPISAASNRRHRKIVQVVFPPLAVRKEDVPVSLNFLLARKMEEQGVESIYIENGVYERFINGNLKHSLSSLAEILSFDLEEGMTLTNTLINGVQKRKLFLERWAYCPEKITEEVYNEHFRENPDNKKIERPEHSKSTQQRTHKENKEQSKSVLNRTVFLKMLATCYVADLFEVQKLKRLYNTLKILQLELLLETGSYNAYDKHAFVGLHFGYIFEEGSHKINDESINVLEKILDKKVLGTVVVDGELLFGYQERLKEAGVTGKVFNTVCKIEEKLPWFVKADYLLKHKRKAILERYPTKDYKLLFSDRLSDLPNPANLCEEGKELYSPLISEAKKNLCKKESLSKLFLEDFDMISDFSFFKNCLNYSWNEIKTILENAKKVEISKCVKYGSTHYLSVTGISKKKWKQYARN